VIEADDGDTLRLEGIMTGAQLQAVSRGFTFHAWRPAICPEPNPASRTRMADGRVRDTIFASLKAAPASIA
jgi:hypothetical protein